MINRNQRTHSYYAEAHALGQIKHHGRVESKHQVFLDPVGGSRNCQFGIIDNGYGISVDSATLEVVGEPISTGGWRTTAFCEVKGLNVRDCVKATRIAGRVTTDHPAQGYVPTLTFGDLTYEGLTVCDQAVTAEYKTDIVGPKPAEPQFKDPEANPYLIEYIQSEAFVRNVQAQDAAIANNERAPGWARARFSNNQENGKVKCSLVSRTSGLSDDVAFGHVIDASGCGKIFLAELVVGEHFDLTMMRLEFYDGTFTVGGPATNGKTRP